MSWSSLLSSMNSTCVDSFGTWAVVLETGDEFKLVKDSVSVVVQFMETNKTTAFMIEENKPAALTRGTHIMIVGDRDIYEVADLSLDKTGGVSITLEILAISFDDLSNEYDLITERQKNNKLARLALL